MLADGASAIRESKLGGLLSGNFNADRLLARHISILNLKALREFLLPPGRRSGSAAVGISSRAGCGLATKDAPLVVVYIVLSAGQNRRPYLVASL